MDEYLHQRGLSVGDNINLIGVLIAFFGAIFSVAVGVVTLKVHTRRRNVEGMLIIYLT